MGSKRKIKKNVNTIAEELMIDAFTFGVLYPDKNKKALSEVVEDILAFRNNTVLAINATGTESTEPIRKQFKNILTKMEAELTLIVEKMQQLQK